MTLEGPEIAPVRARRALLQAELSAVIAALWFDIDHNGGTAAADFFVPDGLLRFADAEFHGRAEIAAVYAARRSRGARVSRHLAANVHLRELAPTRVQATSVVLLFAQDGMPPRPTTSPVLIGDVVDQFILVNDEWRIASRWLQNMFIEPDTELAVPQTPQGGRK
ncbi:nuclear transport factor 2 family protein [Streptomyces chartreusis]|uniref:nuclear transport factor 2 family protein n=1 Tax=Streptomyces chartreusis TaxID=1969 RepID=UPI002F91B164|nr:nuclear transport factor 2 family protein [Streptomyces chartreusis]WTA33525.1 nuclear transport factor 2 family protein [Streptomyces chartreusis]